MLYFVCVHTGTLARYMFEGFIFTSESIFSTVWLPEIKLVIRHKST